MKAVILVGGYGTRLRPLTLSIPKPLVEFANKPMIVHQIEVTQQQSFQGRPLVRRQALREAGCTEVILAIAYQCQEMSAFVDEWEERLGVRIVISEETSPLGTAGPLALARELIRDDHGQPFFLLNGDVVCSFPFKELLRFHHARDAEVTLLVTEVPEPSRFGAVVSEKDGRVACYVEKPTNFLSAKINAGIYVIHPSVLERIEIRPTSFEKEILPAIVAQGKLYSMMLEDAYWTTLIQPDDYLKGLKMYLECARMRAPNPLTQGAGFQGNVLVGEDVQIGESCRIGPNVCIGDGCVIGRGVRLMNCAVLSGTRVGDFVLCVNSLIGWRNVIGKWCRLENGCTFGEAVLCKDELMFNGATVLPHKCLTQSVMQPEIIM